MQVLKDMLSSQEMQVGGIDTELAKPHKAKHNVGVSGDCKIEETTNQVLVFGFQVNI